MYDMKTSVVTIRMESDLQRLLDKVCKQSGHTRSDIVRDALKRQLSILRFEWISDVGCRGHGRCFSRS